MQLPPDLLEAIDRVTAKQCNKANPDSAKKISDRYRNEQRSSHQSLVHTKDEIAAYVGARMPATYAAIYSALGYIKMRVPEFSPTSLLDAGAGPGTAWWAASNIWETLEKAELVERVTGMIQIGKDLLYQSEEHRQSIKEPLNKNILWTEADLTSSWVPGSSDLVIAAYVINELTEKDRQLLIQKLWNATKGVLLIVEPGTTMGWKRILQARDELISQGATLIAPCPHHRMCPVIEPDWCHFSERVNRSRLHRQLKSGELSYEDEKYSYAAFTKLEAGPAKSRIRRHPIFYNGYIELPLCSDTGLKLVKITRSQKVIYRIAKHSSIGDEWAESSKVAE